MCFIKYRLGPVEVIYEWEMTLKQNRACVLRAWRVSTASAPPAQILTLMSRLRD